MVLGAASVALASAPVAHAADAAPGTRTGPAIQELIVTARKREERAIDTPVAIAAMGEEELNRYNTRDLAELTARLPGVQITHAAGGGAGGNIAIRNVGNLAVDYGADQPVSLVIDGMSFTRGHVLDVGFFDLAGVEVLKGPQALFFGKNSPAGVVAVTSRTPTVGSEAEGFVRAGYEFVTEDPVLEAGISFPVTDTIAMRFAARYQDMRGGYLENSAEVIDPNPLYLDALPTRGASYNEWPAQDQRVYRLTTVWEPIDGFDATMKNFYSYTKQNDAGNTVLYRCADGVGSNPYYIVFPDPSQTCGSGPRLRRNGALPPAAIVDAHRHLSSDDEFFNKVENYIHTLEMNYDAGNLLFTSVSGIWRYNHREYTNFDYTSYAVVVSKQGETGKSFSQEFRVQSQFDGPVNFMAGAYYEDMERDLDAPVQILPPIFYGAAGGDPTPGIYNGTYINYHQHWDNNIESFSVFGSVDWLITEQLSLTAGARYTKEERDSVGGNFYQRGLGFSPAGVLYRPEDDSDNVSPEITLSWRPDDELMLYVAYKTGFQSAGISNPGTVPNLSALSPSAQSDALVFDESVVRGFEAGLKGYFFDRAVSTDIIAFHYRYRDLQVGIFNSVTTTFTVQNAAEAVIDGIELQTVWQATDQLQFRLAGQYTRLEFDSFTDAACNAVDEARFSPAGSPLAPLTGPGCRRVGAAAAPRVQDLSGEAYGGPPYQANLGVTWNGQVIPGWDLELSADVIHHSKGEESLNQAGTDAPSRTVTNLSARVFESDGPWEASLICSNCFNEIYVTGIGNKPLGKTGDLTGFIAPPRLVTLQLTYSME